MSVQAFNPTDLSQSATNWAVAQRIVGPFAPHAQISPDMTIQLDPGHLLNGTTLTEVTAQIVGPFTAPTSGFRIDRVVVDRSTGAASIVAGTANSLTPPAIPAGSLPVARVFLENTSPAVDNGMIVDERALADSAVTNNTQIICRAHRNGIDQSSVPTGAFTKLILTNTDFNIGGGFDVANSRFTPTAKGYYLISAQIASNTVANGGVQIGLYKSGYQQCTGLSRSPINANLFAQISDIFYMDGSTDYIEVFGYQNTGSVNSFGGAKEQTFFSASRIG